MKNYADIGPRFLASVIDGIVRSVLFIGIDLAVNVITPFSSTTGATDTTGLVFYFVVGMLAFFAYDIAPTANSGATFGKRMMGITVVDAQGQNIGLGRSFLREVFGKWISGLILSLGFLWALWDPDKQAWHDKIASTYVVKAK